MTLAEIHEIVRGAAAIAKRPDPKEIQRLAIESVDSHGADVLVVWALEQIARKELQKPRRRWAAAEPAEARATAPGPSKWGILQRVNLPALGAGIFVGGAWKWVEDCTGADLCSYAADQWARGRALATVGDIAEGYGKAVMASGVGTVKEWDKLGRPGDPGDLGLAA